MSAELNEKDKSWLLSSMPTRLGKTDDIEAIICAVFDQETDYDEQLILKEIKATKFLKKVCVLRIMLVVPEYVLLRVMFGKKAAKNKSDCTKLYVKFLRNKITLENFKKELQKLAKDSII